MLLPLYDSFSAVWCQVDARAESEEANASAVSDQAVMGTVTFNGDQGFASATVL